MKKKQVSVAKRMGFFIFGLLLGCCSLVAQSTAFNFNGRLSNIGLPVNSPHDMRFSIYGSQAGADLFSGPITVNSVGVRNGLFNCRLDFGEQVFDGSARWLEIGVRPVGAATFTNLSPRVELTSAPYAVRAREAAVSASVANGAAVKSVNSLKDNVTLAAGPNVTITPSGNTLTIGSTGGGSGSWSTFNNNTYLTTGNVGIGITNPTSRLEIVGSQAALKITGYQPVMTLADSGANGIDTAIQSVSGSLNFFSGLYLDGGNPSGFLQLNDNGNVGLGTAQPASKLDVRGGLTLETGGNAILFTGTGASEQNRYLSLFNSPTVASASGLKAGGVLVADSYTYGNPGKNELIVKGNVSAGGDAIQSRDKGGWVKAMAKVNANGSIARNYTYSGGNISASFLGAAYQVIFPFRVDDRFVSVTPFDNGDLYGGVIATVEFTANNPNTVLVTLSGMHGFSEEWEIYVQNEFFIFVY